MSVMSYHQTAGGPLSAMKVWEAAGGKVQDHFLLPSSSTSFDSCSYVFVEKIIISNA